MKKLLLLAAGLAVYLPVAAESVTPYQTNNYTHDGVSIELMDPSGSVYQEGEAVRFAIRNDSDAYVLVFNIDTDGYVQMLYPRNRTSIQRLSSDRTYYIPADPAQELLVTGKTGIEFVFAVSIKDRGSVNEDEIGAMLEDETRPLNQRNRVTGDPFLAANRIANRLIDGIAYTRDESLAYAYFYVNQAVDYPRYLCSECLETGKDPYAGSHDWMATTAFDRADRLTYPLKAAFVRSGESVVADNPGTEVENPAPVTVYNTYYTNPYPYYPGYYSPYWGSSFYFSVGWNWGWGAGWGWGYPYRSWYYPYWGYAYCSPYRWSRPYHGGYYGHGGHYPVAYRPALRPRAGGRYADGRYGTGAGSRYVPKADTASRLRAKSIRYERADKVASAGGTSTRLAHAGRTKSRPVYKVNAGPTVRTRSGTRGYRPKSFEATAGKRSTASKGYRTHSGSRQVRTIKGQPSTRRTITRGGSVSRKSTTRGTGRSKATIRNSNGSSRVKSGTISTRSRSGSKPTVRKSGGSRSSRKAVRSSPSRSVSRGGAARSASRGRSSSASRGGGRRK